MMIACYIVYTDDDCMLYCVYTLMMIACYITYTDDDCMLYYCCIDSEVEFHTKENS